MKNGKYVTKDVAGNDRITYYKDDGPAIVWCDGSKSWRERGERNNDCKTS